MKHLLCFVLAVMLPGALAAQAGAGRVAGQTLVSVSYICDGPVDGREVARLIEVAAGEGFDPDAVRRSIQNLYATERFANIAVDRQAQEGGGIALLFRLYLARRVGSIGFENPPVAREQLRRAAGFEPGAPYQQSVVLEGARRIERLLATEGYTRAKVTPATTFDPKTFNARILYEIARGPVTLAATPIFDGGTAPFTAAQLLAHTRLKPGRRFRESRAQKDAQSLAAFLLSQGRLKAQVSLIGVETSGNTAAPVYRVDVGPSVIFQTLGVTEKKVREEFRNFLKGQVFQEDLLISYVKQLQDEYQNEGYHDAKVDYRIENSHGLVTVTLTVDRGRRHKVSKVVIEGAHFFSVAKIHSLMLTSPPSWLHRGYLVDSVLADDRAAIEGLYQVNGFTQVTTATKIAPAGKAGGLVVEILIQEGPRTIVTSSRISGVHFANQETLSRLLSIRAGRPLSGQAIAADRSAILHYYRSRGWTQAAVEPEVTFFSGRAQALVEYRVTEGSREFFGKTILRGNTKTRSARMLLPFHFAEGDPFDESKLLDTQRDLSRTGTFQRVTIRPAPPDPATAERNIIVDVSEARPISLLYGLGYQYEETTGDQSPFAILGTSYNNLFGSLRSVSLETRYAPFTNEGRLYLNYRDPFLFNSDLPVSASVFYAREPIQKIDVRRRGAFLEGTRALTPNVRFGLRYEFQKIDVESSNPLDVEQLQPLDRSLSESTVGATLLYDARDDPIDPHHGLFLSSFAKGAFPVSFLSADARYLKLYGQASSYVPLWGGVLAGSMRAGVIYTPSSCGGDALGCIPIAERFFSGGRTSDRGFDTNVEGIPGETVDYSIIETPAATPGKGDCGNRVDPTGAFDCDFGPRILGGSAVAGWNLEWRFPISGNIGGTLFYDATQVWQRPADLNFHLEGETGLRQSAGVGLRYLTPVGPVRLEGAWVLHPQTFLAQVYRQDPQSKAILPTGEMAKQSEGTYRIFLSIGYPF